MMSPTKHTSRTGKMYQVGGKGLQVFRRDDHDAPAVYPSIWIERNRYGVSEASSDRSQDD